MLFRVKQAVDFTYYYYYEVDCNSEAEAIQKVEDGDLDIRQVGEDMSDTPTVVFTEVLRKDEK